MPPLRAPDAAARPAGGIVIALAVPFLFLHEKYQPLHVSLGRADVWTSDLAALAVVVAALVYARRYGLGPLRLGVATWIPLGGFLALSFAACVYPLLRERDYAVLTYGVTAAKFAEYALLAPAAVLLLRRRADLLAALAGVALWSAAMTAVGILQFLGLVDELEGRRPGQREPSYVGIHDFSALSAAALAIGLVAVALGTADRRQRAFGILAAVAGALGVVLSGSVAAAGGIAAATLAILLVARTRRSLTAGRGAAVVALAAATCLGVLVLRGSDLDQFARFLGIRPEQVSTTTQVQSYSQRTLLTYIGLRIFLDHPIVGAGYQASAKDPRVFEPYLPDAHRRFPDTAAEAFPSAAHPWGVQNFYVQALADMGVVGLALWLATLGSAVWLAARSAFGGPEARAAAIAGGWLVVVAAIWTARGILAGLPLDALTWLAVGLAVRARAPFPD